ncbi:hypothetical protein, partial [Poseidonibacter lekithochrous]|uniref:hypothetical protein n=1 Tax=Poseidonibacter lekithochrous TaxID=1904463 RepID=UPI000B30620B
MSLPACNLYSDSYSWSTEFNCIGNRSITVNENLCLLTLDISTDKGLINYAYRNSDHNCLGSSSVEFTTSLDSSLSYNYVQDEREFVFMRFLIC